MALANVACLLAEQVGKEESILVVDWDLEAPGLHRFFPPRLSTPEIADLGLDPSPGLIDLFLDIEKALPPSTATSDESADAAVSSEHDRTTAMRPFEPRTMKPPSPGELLRRQSISEAATRKRG